MTDREPESSRVLLKDSREASVELATDATQQIVSGTADTSNDLLVGRLLRGTYRILATLDEGGMGRLYRAEHQRLRRPVAVKVMARYLSANPEALTRFRREAEIVSQLDHPHIVQILDFDTTDTGEPYIVMELLSGETLSRRLDRHRILPLRDTVDIVVQIASGLTLAHRTGVVHRDLKPDNVFLLAMQDGGIFVKLLDFGISKGNPNSTRVTGKYDILGTPDYMAPEQALSTAKADHRADQWSLACMTYEMLTGRVPFFGESAVQILTKVVSESPPPLTQYVPDLPSSIQDVVLRGLTKDPFQRYSTIGDFADRLARAAQILISPESIRAECKNQQVPNSAQRAPTLDGKVRQRTTKPLRAAPIGDSIRPDSATPYSSVAPKKRSLSRNPPPSFDLSLDVVAKKIKPAPARLRTPARPGDKNSDSIRNVSQRVRRPPQDDQQRQAALTTAADREKAVVLPDVKNRTDSDPAALPEAKNRTDSDPAALPEAKNRGDSNAAQLILGELKRALAAGDERRALRSARAALRLMGDGNSSQVTNLISNATDVILLALLQALGGKSKTISMRQRPSSSDNSIGPTHMFLASRIDGPTTIEELLDVSPLSNTETLGILLDFRDAGFLVVDPTDR